MTHRSLLIVVSVVAFSFVQLAGQTAPDEKSEVVEAKAGAVAPTETAPKFTSRSMLVLVPVVVSRKNGTHIEGLGRAAFKIEEQGKIREATIFEEVKTVAPDPKSRPAKVPEGHSNFNFGDAQNWRMTMILVDMLNTPYLSQTEGKRRLIAYLSKQLQRDEPTALFGLSRRGLKELHPFTTDTTVLITALKKLQARAGANETETQSAERVATTSDLVTQLAAIPGGDASVRESSQQIADFLNDTEAIITAFQERQSIRTTLTALMEIANAYKVIPGRKTLIWATSGFPFLINDPRLSTGVDSDLLQQYESTWRALGAADIAVYTVDVTMHGGVGTGMPIGHYDGTQPSWVSPAHGGTPRKGTSVAGTLYDKEAQQRDTLRAFAEETGGTSCTNTNELEGCFALAIEDSRSYYLLGYYLPSEDVKPGWHKLKVKVNAERAHVRAREGFYVSSPREDSDEVRNRQMADALRSPVEYTGVILNVREIPVAANTKPAAAGQSTHDFSVDVLGRSIMVDSQNGNAVDLSVIALAFGADGKNAGQIENRLVAKLKPEILTRVRNSGLGMRQSLELAPGNYELRFAVRDNLSGEIGSVGYPFEVK